jgi:undecaprenyl pyrophosphate phosphatase UppP
MTDDPNQPDRLLPPLPPSRPLRDGSSRRPFYLGILYGLLLATVPAVILGVALASLGARIRHMSLVCWTEFVIIGIVVVLVVRRGRSKTGQGQGIVVGVAIAFLLCAACWGIISLQLGMR